MLSFPTNWLGICPVDPQEFAPFSIIEFKPSFKASDVNIYELYCRYGAFVYLSPQFYGQKHINRKPFSNIHHRPIFIQAFMLSVHKCYTTV